MDNIPRNRAAEAEPSPTITGKIPLLAAETYLLDGLSGD
jgi:hypothetical protein